MTHATIRLGLLATLAAGPAVAQAPMPAMPGMKPGLSHDMPGSADNTEMMRQMTVMDKAMANAPMTGDPDQDFVSMMTPHHQGAIDMARIYLRDGQDPAIRRMAQTIIAGQEREIREFKAWQARHPAPRR